MPKTLIFDIWGQYAHYKKIYATTSAVSYVIPSKTSIYGYVGAILGLEKDKNVYLQHFQGENCRIALQLMRPIVMQRINTNLRAVMGRMKPTDNRKPTTVEYVYQPKYRIYFQHQDEALYQQLKEYLMQHLAVYTPSMGLANLIANFAFIGEYDTRLNNALEASTWIQSVIPLSAFIRFDIPESFRSGNEIIKQHQYALAMDQERNVTQRTDILLDRAAKPIKVFVKEYEAIEGMGNIVFF